MAESLICVRCKKPVVRNAEYFDSVFERMHYVCFHYEFEHGTTDVDEECGGGGCPSATTGPRPERRLAYIVPGTPVEALQKFAAAAMGGWSNHAEHDDMLAADLDLAMTRYGQPRFRFVNAPTDGRPLVLTLEWLGPNPPGGATGSENVVDDFLGLLGFVCMETFFVERRWFGKVLKFLIVTASMKDDPGHGHVLRVDVVGPHIDRIMQEWTELANRQ